MNQPNKLFLQLLNEAGISEPICEHRFHDSRKWRFDYAWPDAKIALEVEGGIWTQGRHSRGAGMQGDMEKYNTAAALGWRIIRTTPRALCSSVTLEFLSEAMNTNQF